MVVSSGMSIRLFFNRLLDEFFHTVDSKSLFSVNTRPATIARSVCARSVSMRKRGDFKHKSMRTETRAHAFRVSDYD